MSEVFDGESLHLIGSNGLVAVFLLASIAFYRWWTKNELHSFPGEWHPFYSAKPADEAIDFALHFSRYMSDAFERGGGGNFVKIHPGVKAIAVGDHSAASFILGSSTAVFDREPVRRFTAARVCPQIVGAACPALTTNESSGHPQARSWTLAIMEARKPYLADAVEGIITNLKDSCGTELLHFSLHINAMIVFKWIFDSKCMPSMEDVMWYIRNALNLESDTPIAALHLRVLRPSKKKGPMKRLLGIVKGSHLFYRYVAMARDHALREASDTDAVARNLLFTFMLGSYGVGLSLCPSIAMLSSKPSTVKAILEEQSTSRVGLKTPASQHPLLHSVSLELLRLFPAPTQFARFAKRDVDIPCGKNEVKFIPKGTRVVISAVHSNIDELAFGPDAREFNPTRFIDNPSLVSQLLIFGIPHMSQSGSAKMCPVASNFAEEDLPRVNPHGCAAAEAGFALPLFKTVLSLLFASYKWRLDQPPLFNDAKYQGFVGPINIKLSSFDRRDAAQKSTDFVYDYVPSTSSIAETMSSGNSIEDKFEAASNQAKANASQFTLDQQTKLYGLYKQITSGDAPVNAPSIIQVLERKKWGVHSMFRGLSKAEAMTQYVDVVKSALQVPDSLSISSRSTTSTAYTVESEATATPSQVSLRYHGPRDDVNEVFLLVSIRCKPILNIESRDDLYQLCAMNNLQLHMTYEVGGETVSLEFGEGIGSCFLRGLEAEGELFVPASAVPSKRGALKILLCQITTMDGSNIDNSNMALYISSIEVSVPELSVNRRYLFDNFVGANGDFAVFDESVSINDLQGDLSAAAEMNLMDRRKVWRWSVGQGGLPQAAFEDPLLIPDVYEVVKSLASHGRLYELMLPNKDQENTNTRAAGIRDYYNIVVAGSKSVPASIRDSFESDPWAWADDGIFSQLAVTGTHPHHLFKLEPTSEVCELLEQVTPQMLGGSSVQQVLDDGRFFFLEYKLFTGLDVDEDRFLPSPTCLFYRPAGQEEMLVPIVILMDDQRSSSAFAGEVATPSDRWKWMMAKTMVRNADTNYLTIVAHYLYSHLAPEMVALSAYRSLPSAHPVMRFLKPHFRGTFAMNIFARKLILGAICDKSSAHGAVDDILFKAWQDNELHERLLNFKRDLKIRGVDKESLPSYPYRDDGLLVMKAIENYCQSIVKECYSSDELVQSDRFLGDFLGELTRTGYFGWMDDETPAESTRPLNESREYLSQFLSNLVFNVSATHSTMNYNMFESLGFAPLSPITIQNVSPQDGYNESNYFKLLPSLEVAGLHLYTEFLSEKFEHEQTLGSLDDDGDGATFGAAARREFKKSLEGISKVIQKRQSSRTVKYDLLDPKNIASSVIV